ncbi:MAG: cyclophane-containing peptide 2OG-Fe(II) oxygenase YhhC, partial [Acidobacteriaceae bacterium]
NGALQRNPFPHVVVPDCIDQNVAESLLKWFERIAPWQASSINDFYQLFDLDLRTVALPPDLRILLDDAFLEDLCKRVGELMESRLSPRIDVTAHKMLPGCHIGIHNDFGTTGQTHRLLIHLNRGWRAENGGLLMLFGNEQPSADSEDTKCFVPHHGRAIGFEISPRSFHAVSKISSGERYALCFSFYAAAASRRISFDL